MYPLKQSTTLNALFFAFDVNGDGVTGKLDGDFTKRISKNGDVFTPMTVTITERENGFYHLQLSAAHSDTLGILTVSLSSPGMKRVNLQYRVHTKLTDDLATQTSVDALVPSGGSGAFVITVLVTDGVVPLQGASVRVTEGVTSIVQSTNASGNASFSLNAATYQVSVTKAGYLFTPTTRTVTGAQAGTLINPLVMTAVAIPLAPAEVGLCRLFGFFETWDNLPGEGIITFELVDAPTKTASKSERVLTRTPVTAEVLGGNLCGVDGNLWVDLQRTDIVTPAGATYTITAPNIFSTPKTGVIMTTATLDLATLIT